MIRELLNLQNPGCEVTPTIDMQIQDNEIDNEFNNMKLNILCAKDD